jgi:hypothetical protein
LCLCVWGGGEGGCVRMSLHGIPNYNGWREGGGARGRSPHPTYSLPGSVYAVPHISHRVRDGELMYVHTEQPHSSTGRGTGAARGGVTTTDTEPRGRPAAVATAPPLGAGAPGVEALGPALALPLLGSEEWALARDRADMDTPL